MGFFDIPDPIINTDNGKDALIVPYGSNIGSIKTIQFDDFGMDYVDPPLISSLFRTILGTKQTINIGEKIRIPGSTYNHSSGPIGVIREFDASKNLITIFMPHIEVTVNSENDYIFQTQEGIDIRIEGTDSLSYNWECDVSKKTLVPLVETRCFAQAGADGVGYDESVREKSASVLNNRSTMITNHYDIQEFGYTIFTGIDIREYSKLVSNILHPAGYQMVGRIRDYAFADCKMRTDYKTFGSRAGDMIKLTIYLDDDDSRGHAAPMSVEGYVVDLWKDWPVKWTYNDNENLKNDLRFSCHPRHKFTELYDIDTIVSPQNIVKTIGGTTYTLNKSYAGSIQGFKYVEDGTPMCLWEHYTIEGFEAIPPDSWYNPIFKDPSQPIGSEWIISTEKVWMHDPDRVNRDAFVLKTFYTLS